MPAPERSHRKQAAVLWPANGIDRYGQVTVGSPVEIRVQWSDSKTEALDPQGNKVSLDATVIVNRDVAIGSHMWKGELQDWYGTGSDTTTEPDTEIMQVKTVNDSPDIRNRSRTRTVGLMRLRADLHST